MWADFLKNTVLKPFLERMGTISAVALVTGGDWLCRTVEACGLVTQAGAEQVTTYLVAVLLLGVDLAVIHVNRRGRK